MTNKEKLFHVINLVTIPISILSALLLVRMGRMADAGQISMDNPVTSLSSLLLWDILGLSVIWLAVSGLDYANNSARVRNGGKGKFKAYLGIVIFFLILLVLSIFTPLWMFALASFALYLFVISAWALITNHFSEMNRNFQKS